MISGISYKQICTCKFRTELFYCTFPDISVPYTVKMVGLVNPALWNSVQMRSGFIPMITDAQPDRTYPGT